MVTINVNGTSLYYREAGSGESLLLIPGTGFTADVWEKVFDALARDYRTIAYDRRAYQRSQGSPPPGADYTRQQGEDIAALLEAIDAIPANLLAWSAGGIYALYATLMHPNVIRAEAAALTGETLKNAPKPELLSTQVRVPVTILIGMESPAPFKKAAENVARILHDAPIVWLPESNHLAQIDQPEHFVEAVHSALAHS